MKIAISSLSGAGTTTACNKVAKAIGLQVVNYTLRQIAEERGVPFETIQAEAEKDDRIDYLVDGRLITRSDRSRNSITGSRLACWLVDADLYVWLSASVEVRAARRAKEDGVPMERALYFTKMRDEKNIARYKRLYGVDVGARPQVDIEINTDNLNADQVAALIVAAARAIGASRGRRRNSFKGRILAKIKGSIGMRALGSRKP